LRTITTGNHQGAGNRQTGSWPAGQEDDVSEPRPERYDATGATDDEAAADRRDAGYAETAGADTTYSDSGRSPAGTSSGATAYGDNGQVESGYADTGLGDRADDRLGSDAGTTGGLTSSGVDVDDRLDSAAEGHDHRLVDPDEHVHELPTMGVDVDAALDRAVDENL